MNESNAKRIAYCGIEGAFAHIAAKKIFPNDNLIPFPSFKKAYDSVEKNECDYAVLPLENSFAGDVNQVFDLMFRGKLYVTKMFKLKIEQTLLGIKGTKLSDIKAVISHQQAIDQCIEYIHSHNFQIETASNTAIAANLVSQKNDKSFAAIGSEETANLYNLEIIEKNINNWCSCICIWNNITSFNKFTIFFNKFANNTYNLFCMFITDDFITYNTKR